MIIPTDWFGLGVVAALLVPGMAYGGATRFLGGYRPHDKTVAASVLRALLVSIVFDAFYFTAFGFFAVPLLADPVAVITAAPALTGATFGLLALVLPAVVALTVHKVGSIDPSRVSGRWRRLVERAASRSRSAVPTAWDWAISGQRGQWVRIRISEATWVGGKWDAGSLASAYPERPEIFLTEPWTLDSNGAWISPVKNGDGTWVSVEPAYVVVWEHSASAEIEESSSD